MIIILNLFLINSHYSNNNNCFFPLLAHRLDDLIYFFPHFFLCWKSLALLAFLFFTLTNNNTHNPHFHHYHHHLPPFFISLSVEGHGIAVAPWRPAFTIIKTIYNSSSPQSTLPLLPLHHRYYISSPSLDLHSLFSSSHRINFRRGLTAPGYL